MLLKPGCDLRNTQHNTQQKWPVLKNRKFSIFYATRQIRCVLRSSRTQPLTTKNRKQRTAHIAIFEKFISPDLMCQFWWFISFCDPAIVVYNPVPEFLWNSRISVQLMVNLSKWRKKSEKKNNSNELMPLSCVLLLLLVFEFEFEMVYLVLSSLQVKFKAKTRPTTLFMRLIRPGLVPYSRIYSPIIEY